MNGRRGRWFLGAVGLGTALVLGALGLSRLSKPEVARAETPRAGNASSGLATTDPSEPQAAAARVQGPPALREGEVVMRASWGGAPGELGHRGGEEASPEAPMSFAVDAHGRQIVLDQVNGRVQVFDKGKLERVVRLPSETVQDIAIRGDGLVALDRLGSASVSFIDEDGHVSNAVALEGKGVESGGDVTALEQRDDGTWVEVKHQEWVRVADASGAPDPERATLEGRLAPDGSALRLARAGGARASLVRIDPSGSRSVTWLAYDMPVWALNALETDPTGRVFVGAELARERDTEPFDVTVRMEEVIVLDPSGKEVDRLALTPSTGAEESFRTLRVGPDGALYQFVFDAEGASIRRYAQ